VKKVLVVGDVIADVYRECIFKKMCPDAPDVMALVDHSRDIRPGGAANVAVNLAALAPDVQIHLVGEMSPWLARGVKQLSRNRVNMDYCLFTEAVLTKERIVLDGELQIRLDNKLCMSTFTGQLIEQKLKEYLSENDPDLILLSDYGSGSVNESSLGILLGMRERLLVDTKMTDLSVFGQGGKTCLVKLNYDEWKAVVATEAAPERFFEAMVMTRGAGGAYLSMRTDREGGSKTHTLRTLGHKVETVDVCGCGDTFLAGLGASLLRNDDYFTAVQFANAAAATVVTKARTSVADLELTLGLLGRRSEDEARG